MVYRLPTSEYSAQVQAAGIRRWYGVRAVARGGLVYVAQEDWKRLEAAVNADIRIDAIGRGFYLGGNGNTLLAPAWTLDEGYVAALRRRVKLDHRRRWR